MLTFHGSWFSQNLDDLLSTSWFSQNLDDLLSTSWSKKKLENTAPHIVSETTESLWNQFFLDFEKKLKMDCYLCSVPEKENSFFFAVFVNFRAKN